MSVLNQFTYNILRDSVAIWRPIPPNPFYGSDDFYIFSEWLEDTYNWLQDEIEAQKSEIDPDLDDIDLRIYWRDCIPANATQEPFPVFLFDLKTSSQALIAGKPIFSLPYNRNAERPFNPDTAGSARVADGELFFLPTLINQAVFGLGKQPHRVLSPSEDRFGGFGFSAVSTRGYTPTINSAFVSKRINVTGRVSGSFTNPSLNYVLYPTPGTGAARNCGKLDDLALNFMRPYVVGIFAGNETGEIVYVDLLRAKADKEISDDAILSRYIVLDRAGNPFEFDDFDILGTSRDYRLIFYRLTSFLVTDANLYPIVQGGTFKRIDTIQNYREGVPGVIASNSNGVLFDDGGVGGEGSTGDSSTFIHPYVLSYFEQGASSFDFAGITVKSAIFESPELGTVISKFSSDFPAHDKAFQYPNGSRLGLSLPVRKIKPSVKDLNNYATTASTNAKTAKLLGVSKNFVSLYAFGVAGFSAAPSLIPTVANDIYGILESKDSVNKLYSTSSADDLENPDNVVVDKGKLICIIDNEFINTSDVSLNFPAPEPPVILIRPKPSSWTIMTPEPNNILNNKFGFVGPTTAGTTPYYSPRLEIVLIGSPYLTQKAYDNRNLDTFAAQTTLVHHGIDEIEWSVDNSKVELSKNTGREITVKVPNDHTPIVINATDGYKFLKSPCHKEKTRRASKIQIRVWPGTIPVGNTNIQAVMGFPDVHSPASLVDIPNSPLKRQVFKTLKAPTEQKYFIMHGRSNRFIHDIKEIKVGDPATIGIEYTHISQGDGRLNVLMGGPSGGNNFYNGTFFPEDIGATPTDITLSVFGNNLNSTKFAGVVLTINGVGQQTMKGLTGAIVVAGANGALSPNVITSKFNFQGGLGFSKNCTDGSGGFIPCVGDPVEDADPSDGVGFAVVRHYSTEPFEGFPSPIRMFGKQLGTSSIKMTPMETTLGFLNFDVHVWDVRGAGNKDIPTTLKASSDPNNPTKFSLEIVGNSSYPHTWFICDPTLASLTVDPNDSKKATLIPRKAGTVWFRVMDSAEIPYQSSDILIT